MRKEVAVLVVVSVVLLTSASSSKVIDFEAARGMSNGILRTRPDGKRTVYLKMNQYITNNFFVNSSCLVTVDNVDTSVVPIIVEPPASNFHIYMYIYILHK